MAQKNEVAMANTVAILERAVKRATGEDVETLRKTPLGQQRKKASVRTGEKTKFVTRFPLIGRGNVLGNRIKTTDQINAELNEAFQK